MTAVKGSKEYQWQVVKHRPGLRIAVTFVSIAVLLASSYSMYLWGSQYGKSDQEYLLDELASAQTSLSALKEEKVKIAQEFENMKLGGEVDQQSLENVRQEVLELRSTIAALEEDNQFYRNLMAPSGNKRGLNFGSLEVASTENPRAYHFKFVIQQLAASHQLLTGALNVNIVGRENGEVKVFSLNDLSKDIDSTNIKLRFKYFQNIEGDLSLPIGFEPERIELIARSSGKSATSIEKRLAWLVQET